MKKLPVGIQGFRKLRKGDFLYIDKTEQIFNLLHNSYYFLSRPRRFGKSLLINTFKELFLGNKDLFKGLWIEDKIEWKKHPVVHFDFSKADFVEIGLENAILDRIQMQAELYDIEIKKTSVGGSFEELIKKLAKKYNEQVVILIDEYDNPIIDFLGENEIPTALKHRDIMKNFYSPIKNLDESIRFFFLTGVSRFSKVTVFSELNHLKDLTINPLGETLVGYTESEVYEYFAERIAEIAQKQNIREEELKAQIRLWYNGYSFGGERLYNPFSVLNFMQDRKFNNYWFETGTPTFLIKMLAKGGNYNVSEVETDISSLGNFQLENIDPIVVLFQTGYLTIQEDLGFDFYRLGYPNKEVQNSMQKLLLAEYSTAKITESNNLLFKIKRSFDNHKLDDFFVYFNALFAKIPHQIFEERLESYYHAIIYLTFELLGYYSNAEVNTSLGRIDAVIQNEAHIYILEFKVNDTAESAMKQIKEKKYYEKFMDMGKQIHLIGIACQSKKVIEYLIEEL